MKRVLLVLLLVVGVVWGAEAGKGRPSLGVRLEEEGPAVELLRGHLKLGEGEGLLVQNVQVGSPADAAGLERGDMVVMMDGEEVKGYPEFAAAIHRAGVGKEVKLEVIQAGERRQVAVTLGAYEGEGQWKYEVEEPAGQQGRVWRMEPGERNWRAVPPGEMPEPLNRFFEQRTIVTETEDGRRVEITIEGDARSDEAEVRVRDLASGETHATRLGELDKLPEEYRGAAEKAIEMYRGQDRMFDFPMPFGEREWPELWRGFRQEQWPRLREEGQERIEELRKQLKETEERLRGEFEEQMRELREQTEALRRELEEMRGEGRVEM